MEHQADKAHTDLDRLATLGNFPYRPSDLFLRIYGEVLEAARAKPESAVVSPALLGTSGVVPLSIISIIPDIMLQYADCIKASKREVLIATNAWEPGRCVDIVVAAIRELNKTCAREGRRVMVKLLMDAASIRNAIQPRYVGVEVPYVAAHDLTISGPITQILARHQLAHER